MSRLLLVPLVMALVACCCCGQLSGWLPPTIQRALHQVPRFEEAPCPFDVWGDARIECGFVVVPEDHNKPDGPTIRLATSIVRDRSSAHQPDPVVLLSGGPGGYIVEYTVSAAAAYEPLYAYRDFVLFDQRGVGLSEPALECPEWEQKALDLLDEADPDLSLQEEYEAIMACRDRLVAEGYNLSLYNTTQNAADVDAIRLALGYDEIDLYGASYGSFLAQAVMRDYPQHIRSVVMTSVLPLETSFTIGDETVEADGIMRLIDTCAADEACNDAYPNLQDVLFQLIDDLNEDPVPIVVTDPDSGEMHDALLTGDTVRSDIVLALYSTPTIPVLPRAIFEAYQGDYKLMTELTGESLWVVGGLSRGMQFSVVCTEDLIGHTPQDQLEAMMSVPSQLRSSADPELYIEYGIFGVCANWPVEQADSSFKEPLVSSIPTLVLEGELDPVTPPEYGRLVAGYLSDVCYYEIPGAGHGVLAGDDCSLGIANAFVEDPSQAPDASCIAQMPGVVFDLPRELTELVLKPFTDEPMGLSGLVPEGWEEQFELDFRRGESALDPTRLVLGATWLPKDQLLNTLLSWLEIDEDVESVATTAVGNFTWDFYEFRAGAYPVDVALAEDNSTSYLVLLISPRDERDTLYDKVFVPVVEALAPLD
jgi:pimeloyl-ACP methyl ester carboxylesterase